MARIQSSSPSRFDLQKHPLLETFFISDGHLPTHEQRKQAGKDIIAAFKRDSIINISMEGICSPDVIKNAFAVQKQFFNMPQATKTSCANKYSYGGYVYSGEEYTADKKDAAEIFTVTPEFSYDHQMMKQNVPCHGPVPWPFEMFKYHMTNYMNAMRSIGDKVLPLIALGLGMAEDAFTDLTKESWGHMRVLKFLERNKTNLSGIGSHTDYGMLVIAAQDHVGGLWVFPQKEGEGKENWNQSCAGMYSSPEYQERWKFVVPESNVLTCFPGDMLQFITGNAIMSTSHKVELADEERYSLAYFHEPSFGAVIRREDNDEKVHYGEHFTNMFMRCYPHKPVTKRIQKNGLQDNLSKSITGYHTY